MAQGNKAYHGSDIDVRHSLCGVYANEILSIKVLDWWFNTPSNHRVHHAVNPEYIDRSLGGIFMLYDHLF